MKFWPLWIFLALIGSGFNLSNLNYCCNLSARYQAKIIWKTCRKHRRLFPVFTLGIYTYCDRQPSHADYT